MPAVTKKSIAQWAREAMLDDNYGKIQAIVLSFDNGYKPTEIDNVVFGTKAWSPEDLETRFLGKCENYCGATDGRHQFVLEAFYSTEENPKDNGVARNQMRFAYDVKNEEYSGVRFDTPNEKGLLTQLMRHAEVLTDRVLRTSEMAINASQRTIERLYERNETVEKENREAWDIIRDFGNRLMDKRNEHELQQLSYQRNTMLISQWMKFGPALLNQLLGTNIFPQDTADSSLIEATAEALDEETIAFLANKLRPELWGVLSNRFTQVLESKRSAMQRDEKLLATGKNPEDQAAGDVSITKTKVEP